MPRTPLGNWICRIARIAGESVQRDAPVDEVAEEQEERRWNRREFIAAGLKSAAATAVGMNAAPVLAAERIRSQPVVAIVGAGLAGLTCAYRLNQAGIRAKVYEATSRLGGRCLSLRNFFEEGQLAERGGEMIDSKHRAIRRLAREFHLPLDDLLAAEARGTRPQFYFSGSHYSLPDAARDFRELFSQLAADIRATDGQTLYDRNTPRGAELDKLSVADYIGRYVPGGANSRLGKLLDVAYTIEFGADSTGLSSLNLLYLLGAGRRDRLELFGDSDERYHVRGGNDQLVSRLASHLPDQIETGCVLTAVALKSDGRYTISFDQGASAREVVADHVVLALPFSILRHSVDYSQAAFSDRKRIAIQELGMGANVKLHLQFLDRDWVKAGCNGSTYSDSGYQNTWETTRAQAGRSGILVNFTGGTEAAHKAQGEVAQHAAKFLDQIRPLLPGLPARHNGRSTIDFWPGNPWTRGSYSFWKVGQCIQFAGVEAMPEGRCHFCGEHTSIDFMGYLNGAVDSGERAAREIIRAKR